MPLSVRIQLTTAGASTGPTFNLYSNVDNYTTAFESNVPKASLVNGYLTSLVPDSTTIIKVEQSGGGPCINETFITIQ